MFDRNSDYALNKKDPDAIVCKSATGIHIRLARLDFSSQGEFEKWKQWSDQDYHHTEKKDHVYANHTVPTDKLVEVSVTVISPEEELMEAYDRQERERLYLQLKDGLELCLTSAQRRRLWLYLEGLTENNIAKAEGVRQQSISECLQAALKKLKNFFKNTL